MFSSLFALVLFKRWPLPSSGLIQDPLGLSWLWVSQLSGEGNVATSLSCLVPERKEGGQSQNLLPSFFRLNIGSQIWGIQAQLGRS